MIPTAFDYVAPVTVEEALSALAQHGDEAKIMAGGQSLLPVLRMRLNAPEVVIDLGRIDALRGVRDDGDAIVIGAMTPHFEVASDPLVSQHAELITKAVHELADAQIRHLGVNDVRMPCTPERVWQAIQDGGRGSSTEGAAMPHFGDGDAAGNQETPGASSTGSDQEGAGA